MLEGELFLFKMFRDGSIPSVGGQSLRKQTEPVPIFRFERKAATVAGQRGAEARLASRFLSMQTWIVQSFPIIGGGVFFENVTKMFCASTCSFYFNFILILYDLRATEHSKFLRKPTSSENSVVGMQTKRVFLFFFLLILHLIFICFFFFFLL